MISLIQSYYKKATVLFKKNDRAKPDKQFPVDLVTFIEKIVNRKLHFLCSADDNNDIEIILMMHCNMLMTLSVSNKMKVLRLLIL